MLVFFAVIPLLGASSLILFGGAVESAVLDLLKVDPILLPAGGDLAGVLSRDALCDRVRCHGKSDRDSL